MASYAKTPYGTIVFAQKLAVQEAIMNKLKKTSTNENGTKPTRKRTKPKVEFLPVPPIKELKKKKEEDLTPEEALMLAWHESYTKRHKRLI